jgi:hypothetical protein
MSDSDFEPDSYFGSCSFCGVFQQFERTHKSIRETYRCGECKALLREREQAQALLNCFASLQARSIAELVECTAFRRLKIYEPGTIGAFRRYLRGLPYYQQSDYYAAADRHRATPEVPHCDLEALGFCDDAFDLVLTSDILERSWRAC